MATEFGLKELYEVVIRTTYPVEIDGREIVTGEAIAVFDSIQIANFQEIKQTVSARGGYDNRGLIYWDTTKEINISFVQGIFSKVQFALMSNAKLISPTAEDVLTLSCREVLESSEEKIITLTHAVATGTSIFVYNNSTGAKLTYEVIDDTHISISTAYTEVLVDYSYSYQNTYKVLTVGQALTKGFLSLEGKTRIKDDITGQTHTGILYIPKLKLMSDLSMRLGDKATPLIGTLKAVAVPTGDRNNTEVMHLIFLDDDIDSDM